MFSNLYSFLEIISNKFRALKAVAEPEKTSEEKRKISGIFSTDISEFNDMHEVEIVQQAFAKTFQKDPVVNRKSGKSMDSCCPPAGSSANTYGNYGVPAAQIAWYGSQGFIGYQLCAMISQQWLVRLCCLLPARDATRKGFEITSNDGKEISPEIMDSIRQSDKKYRVKKNMLEFIAKGKIFGIRVCIFQVESSDKDYYLKPFNIDSVKPGSYRGMNQVDPYFITPELDNESAANPASQDFYEPTWWRVNGIRYHRTHLAIYREDDGQMADVLKPTYMYGGISIPQKIYERVYAAERTANEAPMLALSKRTRVYKTDLSQATAQGQSFFQKILQWVRFSNNNGIQVIGEDDEVTQFDTSLTDFDSLIMTQYELVPAAARVPATKLFGKSPKGLNATGESEESNYHEDVENLQFHDLTPMAERHYELNIKSDIAPKFGIKPFQVNIGFNPLDAVTEKEAAEIRNIDADTDLKLSQAFAIDGNDIRDRLITDPKSGYSGISSGAPEPQEEESDGDSDSEKT